MSNRLLASLKKKPSTPPPVQPPRVAARPKFVLPEHVYLYYDDEDEFCQELIRILVIVPLLTKKIKCINVNDYEVDKKIDALPTIDAGDVDEDDEPILHKMEDAFSWVLHQCYLLLDMGLDHKTFNMSMVTKIEGHVKVLFFLDHWINLIC